MRRGDTHDLVVIGAGSAGLTAAGGCAQLGLKVALVERAVLGGECLTTGCVPSKSLIAAARRAHDTRTGDALGLPTFKPKVDLPAVMAQVREVQAAIAPHDSQERFEAWGVEVVRGSARFLDRRSVEVDGRRLAAPRLVIATGSKPTVPPLEGLAGTPFLTNETVWDLRVLPERLLVLGAGAVGLELAQAFSRLGSKVVVVEGERAFAHDDRQAAEVVLKQLAAEGVEVREHAKARSVARTPSGGVKLELESGETVEGDRLLVAVGRTAVTEGLDLERAGVRVGEGGIEVDARRRTSNRRIYAIGDCRPGPRFSHVAGYEGALVVSAVGFGLPARTDYAALPWVTFTEPELAQVGLTEEAARERYGTADVVCECFSDNDRAQTDHATMGFVKLVRAKSRLRGATVVGAGAGDLVLPLALCIGGKASVSALASVIVPYPTRSEAAKAAAYATLKPLIYGRLARRWARLLAALRR